MSSVNTEHLSTNICSIQSINIDTLSTRSNFDPNTHTNNTLMTVISNNIKYFESSWEQQILTGDHSTVINIVQINFTIPYTIVNNSILNKTIFITDVIHNELLASLTNICINESSFLINYSTIKSLPHHVCLYLLLNLTSSTIFREIMFCRTIDYQSNRTSSLHVSQTETHAVGPSEFFILSQCIIILIMMIVIYVVQTARQKSLVNRVGQRLVRSRPYITVFGNKINGTAAIDTTNATINSATTVQIGPNQMLIHRHLTTVPSFKITAPIEEQVLAANDLTSTIYDRRASGVYINRDLINVKEFTKQMSIPNESSIDEELHVLNTN